MFPSSTTEIESGIQLEEDIISDSATQLEMTDPSSPTRTIDTEIEDAHTQFSFSISTMTESGTDDTPGQAHLNAKQHEASQGKNNKTREAQQPHGRSSTI